MKQCSEEVVLLGILRVIEEIEYLKPNAKIVVNSILPMTTDPKGRVPPFSFKQLRKKKESKPSKVRRLDILEISEKDEKKVKAPTVTIRKSGPFSRVNPFSHIRITMWPSVIVINEQLKRFCAKHKHMVFFDANNVFVEKKEENKFPTVKQELMRSMIIGTPSTQGHEKWHVAIERKLNYIFNKNKGRSKSNIKKEEAVRVEEKGLNKEDNKYETEEEATTSKGDTEVESSEEEISQAQVKEEDEDEN